MSAVPHIDAPFCVCDGCRPDLVPRLVEARDDELPGWEPPPTTGSSEGQR